MRARHAEAELHVDTSVLDVDAAAAEIARHLA